MKAGRRSGGKRRAPAARRIAGARIFDLDDLGAEFAEDHAGIGRRNAVADFDHGKPGKRSSARHRNSRRKRRPFLARRRTKQAAADRAILATRLRSRRRSARNDGAPQNSMSSSSSSSGSKSAASRQAIMSGSDRMRSQ